MKVNENNILGKKLILIEHDAGYISPEDNKETILEFNKAKAEKTSDGRLMLFAVLQKHGVENRNGRIYPKEILEREVNNYQEAINEGRATGELNHPESSIIDLDRISHRITETWWDGSTLMGKMEILTSPAYNKMGIVSTVGDKVADYIRQGVQIGISSRGVGSLKKEHGKNVVQEDFEIICWDIVSSPSTPGSWIAQEEETLRPFVENEIKNKNLIIDNLDNFLGEE